MTKREQRRDRIHHLNQRFSALFPQTEIHSRVFFLHGNGFVFALDEIPDFNGLVMEYAPSPEEAAKFLLEDGDCYDMDDYSEDEMFDSFLREVNDDEP